MAEKERLNDGVPQVQIVDPQQADYGGRARKNACVQILLDLWTYKTTLVVILIPLIALPLAFTGEIKMEEIKGQEDYNRYAFRCLYVVIIMACYWMFEVMPLAATALMPIFLFPILGIMPTSRVAPAYMPHIQFLFIGGLVVAVAVEKCNLHERIALKVLSVVGSQPKWIMLGFMTVTGFLSMFISNTATAAMMLPIARQTVVELVKFKKKRRISQQHGASGVDGDNGATAEMQMSLVRHDIAADQAATSTAPHSPVEEEDEAAELDVEKLPKEEKAIAKALVISIAFSANIGGTGTLTGTPPNIVMVGLIAGKDLYEGAPHGVTYGTWMAFAIPLMLISLVLCWLALLLYFLGFKALGCKSQVAKGEKDPVSEMLKNKYRSLPPMSFSEILVLICFIILLLMWILRKPVKGVPGFGDLFEHNYFKDSTSAIIIAVLLFVLPAEKPDFYFFATRDKSKPPKIRPALMDWPTMQMKFAWSVVLLLGGGFALAKGVSDSGLSKLVGDMLQSLETLPLPAIQLICIILTMIVTNFCSNTVTATLFVVIVGNLASKICIHPLSLILPTTLACSYAFTLPVATPPNAIVFASGMLRVIDMMLSGLLITVVSAVVITVYMNSYTLLIFPIGTMPTWADKFALCNTTVATTIASAVTNGTV